MASPNRQGAENELLGVSARAAKDVWAVGYYGGNADHHTLIEHWNGTAWSVKWLSRGARPQGSGGSATVTP